MNAVHQKVYGRSINLGFMFVKWHGHSCFEFSDGRITVVTDPHDGDSIGLKVPDVKADAVLMTHDHYDHNASHVVKGAHEDHKFHNGPFSTCGVEVIGLPTYHDYDKGSKRGKNTMYTFKIGGVSICHCGDLGDIPEDSVISQMKGIDMLFVPIGGNYTMKLDDVLAFVGKVDPKVVVPMHYYVRGLDIDIDGPEDFLGSIGVDVKRIGNSAEVTDIPQKTECWVFDL